MMAPLPDLESTEQAYERGFRDALNMALDYSERGEPYGELLKHLTDEDLLSMFNYFSKRHLQPVTNTP